jgi:MFS family permease
MPGSATFTSLAEPDFRWYFVGNLAFFMAMQMQFVLRSYLAYDLTQSAASLGSIAVAITLPMLVVAPVGGVVADRVNKKTLLIVTQLMAAAASIIPAVLIIGGWIQFWHLLVVSLVTGVLFSFNMPARSALVPLLVPQHKLMNAISLQMGGMNFTRIFAPATAGVLIAPLGVGAVYLITAILFSIAVLSEVRLPKHGLGATARGTNVVQEFADGLRYVTGDRLIGLLVLTNLLIPFFAFPVQQMLPIFAEDVFAVGAPGLGLLAAMTGVGGLVGAIVAANMDRQAAKGRLMLVGGITMATFLTLFALTPLFGLALGFIMAAGVGQMLFTTTNNTFIQASVPEEMRGRVNSLILMSFGAMPLGVLPLTVIADVVGAPTTIAVSSMLLLVIVLGLFAAVKPLRDLRMEALAYADLSRAQAAMLVAEGKLTQEDADRASGLSAQTPVTVARPPRPT